MKSIIVGTETFADPEAAAQKIAEINNITVYDAICYIVSEADPSDDFITKIEALEANGKNISDYEYLNMYLEVAEEDIIFMENENLPPFAGFI